VPELELRELEDGTRFCQVSERSALAPTVRNEEEDSRCERANLSRKEHFSKAWKGERTERFLQFASNDEHGRAGLKAAAQVTGGIQRLIGNLAQTCDANSLSRSCS
jgi:hypothetical protein